MSINTTNKQQVFLYTPWGAFFTEIITRGDQASTTLWVTLFLERHVKMSVHPISRTDDKTYVTILPKSNFVTMSLLESVTGEIAWRIMGLSKAAATLKPTPAWMTNHKSCKLVALWKTCWQFKFKALMLWVSSSVLTAYMILKRRRALYFRSLSGTFWDLQVVYFLNRKKSSFRISWILVSFLLG